MGGLLRGTAVGLVYWSVSRAWKIGNGRERGRRSAQRSHSRHPKSYSFPTYLLVTGYSVLQCPMYIPVYILYQYCILYWLCTKYTVNRATVLSNDTAPGYSVHVQVIYIIYIQCSNFAEILSNSTLRTLVRNWCGPHRQSIIEVIIKNLSTSRLVSVVHQASAELISPPFSRFRGEETRVAMNEPSAHRTGIPKPTLRAKRQGTIGNPAHAPRASSAQTHARFPMVTMSR